MNDLLATAVAAHGGSGPVEPDPGDPVDATISGAFWQIKGKATR